MKINSFETSRCCIREIEIGDAEQIVKWRTNPEVYKYFKYPVKIDLETHISWFINSYINNANRIDFMVLTKDRASKIGVFGVNKVEENTVEVSYLLDDNEQGKGYASEILEGIENMISTYWNVKKYIAEIHKNNTKSIIFIKKMGYIELKSKGNYIVFGKKNDLF